MSKITTIVFQNTSSADLVGVPVTFGHPFAPGDVPRGAGIEGVQMDVKATHPDGSVRHAVLSMVVPSLGAGEMRAAELVRSKKRPAPVAGAEVSGGLAVFVIVAGVPYATGPSVDTGTWLAGSVVTERRFRAPLQDAAGTPHPHLHVRGSVRQYSTGHKRAEVIVENDWAYEPGPGNITYDVRIEIGGAPVYEQTALTHLHHSRWRKVFWVGNEAPSVHVRHDREYLMHTRAVPNYERVEVRETTLAEYASKWTGPKTQPMGIGLAYPGMPDTGGRNDIGLMPGWSAAWLLSQDPRAKMVMLGTADGAGSWSVHYRDRATDLPVSLIDHPYMTILAGPADTKNPKTGLREAFPVPISGATATPYKHDSAHQPAFAYVPYLATGDYYYLEEMHFWAMYNVFQTNPGYRRNIKGLLADDQVRSQAWSLRTLGEAAYITPDSHPLKRHFAAILSTNLTWYTDKYVKNAATANKLGFVENGAAAVGYAEDPNHDGTKDSKTAVAPWQDDFFTQAVGRLVELGFKDAEPLLQFKIKFPIGRMIGPGTCWMVGANYTYAVRPALDAPFYDNYADAFVATVGPKIAALPCGSAEFGAALDPVQKAGDMGGYSSTPTGFPSNMQPALAYAADYGGEDGKRAWQLFMSRTVKPDYGHSPQFAVIPRTI